MLGRFGHSLSYTEKEAHTVSDGPPRADLRTPQHIAGCDALEAPWWTSGSAGDRPDTIVIVWHMLEAFVEGLQVFARLSARLVLSMFRYAGQRVEDFRDPDRTGQDGPFDDTRPGLRLRMDDRLEAVLNALETRVQACSPIPALRRVGGAFATRTADVRIARIWWPEEEREDEDMNVTALPPPSDPTPLVAQNLDRPDGFDPPAASSSSSDQTNSAGEPLTDTDQDDRPWFLRWSSVFSFLWRRETHVPSVLDRSSDEQPEGVTTLDRLERLLSASADARPTEDEIEALARRRPREL